MEFYQQDEIIIQQGEVATTFHLICQGSASVSREGNKIDEAAPITQSKRRQAFVTKQSLTSQLQKKAPLRKEEKVLNELTEGAYFGEVGLLSGTMRNTSTV